MRINLVMSGGGTRLPAYVGAIRALQELGGEIVRVAGASGGSVVASFLAAGFSPARLREIAVGTDYRQFIDISPAAILRGYGLCAGKRFERWADTLLKGMRFGDLPMDLHVVATDISRDRAVTFSRAATPEVRVAEAVRCSMGIPGYFACHRWRGHMLVDGALVPSALWDLFDTPDARTVYVLLAAPHLASTRSTRPRFWVWDYAFHVVRMLILAMENGRVPAHLWNDTTVIKTGAFSAVDFNMTPDQKALLVEEGYLQVKTHLTEKSDLFRKARSEFG